MIMIIIAIIAIICNNCNHNGGCGILQAICAVATAIFGYPIDSLFKLLSAPTADAAKVKAADGLLKRTGRRLSNAAGSAGRRVSIAAVEALSAAKALALRSERRHVFVVGAPTRDMPESTRTAKHLATASMLLIADEAEAKYESRKTMRLALSSRSLRPSSYLKEGEVSIGIVTKF